MVEMDETAVFQVVLHDGERQMDVGNVKIHSTLNFKEFQVMLSQMIGISYNNLTTYLIDRKKLKISSERQRSLITSKVNFSVLVRERNCYFLVVLKRSRRDRRRKLNQQTGGFESSPSPPSLSPDDLLLLRRHQLNLTNQQLQQFSAYDQQLSPYGSYYYDDRFQDLQVQRENYLNMMLNSNYGFDSPLNANINSNYAVDPPSNLNVDPNYGVDSPLKGNFPKIEEAYPVLQKKQSRDLCKECTIAKQQGKTAPFHFCVYDEVTRVFRSSAGPIRRPR